MNDSRYFYTTSLQLENRALKRELEAFKMGEAYCSLRKEYEALLDAQRREIKKLRAERDSISFSRKEISNQWFGVLDDMEKEHAGEIKKLKKLVTELLDIIASLKRINEEQDAKRKKALADYYDAAVKLEEAQGLITKLTAQVNHDYENSSLPSSKCTGRKKITNNREKTGKKPGAQPGHKHHPRKRLRPDKVVEIEPEEKFNDAARYTPTGSFASRQATMYFAREKKGHAAVRGTPVETFGGILIHDHEACFYSYGSDHQECLVHIERYLKDSIQNEKNLTWNQSMLKLIQEMIHENNMSPNGIDEEKITEFEDRYDEIIKTAKGEYEYEPPSDYYRDGYNLYVRLAEYRHNHLLFLSNPLVEPDNNLCERKARIIKGKTNQAVSLRSFNHLIYFCESLSVIDYFAEDKKENLYNSIREIFNRPKTIIKLNNSG